MNNKSDNLKEKFKQALASTAKVISDDYEIDKKQKQHKDSKIFDLLDIENLNSKRDFIRARADTLK